MGKRRLRLTGKQNTKAEEHHTKKWRCLDYKVGEVGRQREGGCRAKRGPGCLLQVELCHLNAACKGV